MVEWRFELSDRAEQQIKAAFARREIARALEAWRDHVEVDGLAHVESVRAGGRLPGGTRFVWLIRGVRMFYSVRGRAIVVEEVDA